MRLAAFVTAATLCTAGCAQSPNPAWVGGVAYTEMGAGTGAFSAMLDGSTSAAAPYTIRVHMTKGGKIMPHTHPDPRVVTVVDGDLCYGFSDTFDPSACKLYPEGSYFIVPANVPHFGYGKSDAVYQESGVGPSGFVPVAAPAK